MFIVCRAGHLVYYWSQEIPIFLEEQSGIFSSRRDCLDYLIKQNHTKEQAINIIKTMQNKPNIWISI